MCVCVIVCMCLSLHLIKIIVAVPREASAREIAREREKCKTIEACNRHNEAEEEEEKV